MLALLPRFERCVRASQAEASGQINGANNDDTDDEDFVKGCARLFAELGESYTNMIASGRDSAQLIQNQS